MSLAPHAHPPDGFRRHGRRPIHWKPGVVLVLLALSAAAQDLAPETLLLARIKYRVGEELSNLPNYTCLETITRFRKAPVRIERPAENGAAGQSRTRNRLQRRPRVVRVARRAAR